MKRTLALIGFIVATVFLGIDMILELLSLPALIQLLEYANGGTALVFVIITFILLALIMVALVFNALCIRTWDKPVDVFASKKGFIIGTVVLNFIIALLMLFFMIYTGVIGAMQVILFVSLIASNALILIDFTNEHKRVQPVAPQNEEINE